MGFTPNPNGYRFSNADVSWGSDPWPPAGDDFTTADMRVMFGDSQVCHMVGGICTVWWSAIQWNIAVNSKMSSGHCLGMAATSLRFFRHQGHEPGYFQSGATTTHDLYLSSARRNISYYHVEQWTDPMRGYLDLALLTTPTALLARLQGSYVRRHADPVVLIMINQHST